VFELIILVFTISRFSAAPLLSLGTSSYDTTSKQTHTAPGIKQPTTHLDTAHASLAFLDCRGPSKSLLGQAVGLLASLTQSKMRAISMPHAASVQVNECFHGTIGVHKVELSLYRHTGM
jgi:hypothetical protein